MAVPVAAQDLDRDGLADRVEQQLLDKFAPTLLLSNGECDGVPASFVPNLSEPQVLAKDGTLYGQAFSLPSEDGRWQVELHYFHLWSKDCGRLGHDLDVEHVSALVSAPRRDAPAASWIADAWYAAAHEGSACDASSGAQARVLGAVTAGPRVFVSRGKHASYFDRGHCKWGCGSDECGDDLAITPAAVINIGEFDAPLNGALWARSGRWPMAQKFGSDFEPALRARLDDNGARRVIPLMQHLRAPQAPVLAGVTAIEGLVTATESTVRAWSTAKKAMTRFIRRR